MNVNESIKQFEQKIVEAINTSQLPAEVIRLVLENTIYKVVTAVPQEIKEEEQDAESTRCEPE